MLLFISIVLFVVAFQGNGLKNVSLKKQLSLRTIHKSFTTPNSCLGEVSGLLMLYKQFRGLSEGIVEDAIILGMITTVSDIVAQIFEKQSPLPNNLQNILSKLDHIRTRKFAIFGAIDGILSHSWYFALNKYIQGAEIFDIFKKILADTFLFQPIWCVYFLLIMAFLEKKSVEGVIESVRTDWWELFSISTGFYFPLGCLVYSLFPKDAWLFIFSIGNFFYNVCLSLWKARQGKNSLETSLIFPLPVTHSQSLNRTTEYL